MCIKHYKRSTSTRSCFVSCFHSSQTIVIYAMIYDFVCSPITWVYEVVHCRSIRRCDWAIFSHFCNMYQVFSSDSYLHEKKKYFQGDEKSRNWLISIKCEQIVRIATWFLINVKLNEINHHMVQFSGAYKRS